MFTKGFHVFCVVGVVAVGGGGGGLRDLQSTKSAVFVLLTHTWPKLKYQECIQLDLSPTKSIYQFCFLFLEHTELFLLFHHHNNLIQTTTCSF